MKKADLINDAFVELRIWGITSAPAPADTSMALTKLNAMMSELEVNRSLCLGYNFDDTDINAEAGIIDGDRNMVATNLAVRMVPAFNKVVPQELRDQASQSLSAVSGRVMRDTLRQVPAPGRMPIGSGHRGRGRYQRYNRTAIEADNTCATHRMSIGDINDFTEDFGAYLEGETISSFTISATDYLTISNTSNTDDTVSYRAESLTGGNGKQTVTITITTSTARVHKRIIEFELS